MTAYRILSCGWGGSTLWNCVSKVDNRNVVLDIFIPKKLDNIFYFAILLSLYPTCLSRKFYQLVGWEYFEVISWSVWSGWYYNLLNGQCVVYPLAFFGTLFYNWQVVLYIYLWRKLVMSIFLRPCLLESQPNLLANFTSGAPIGTLN